MYGGLRARTMRVWLDRHRLQSLDMDAADLMQALRREHREMPARTIESPVREINVRTMGEAKTAADFAELPILARDTQITRVKDVALVEDGLEDRRSLARFNGSASPSTS